MTMQDNLSADSKNRSLGYSMLFPPGWREFRTTVEFEKVLVNLITAEAKSAGRADVVLKLRQHVHEMFEHLRRRGSLGFAIPVHEATSGRWPASLIVTPLKVGTSGTLTGGIQKVAAGNAVETETVDGTTWYLWDSAGSPEESPGIRSHGINLVVPRPLRDGGIDPDPKAGLWLLYSYAEIDGAVGKEAADGLRQLGHAILGTFKWGIGQ